MSAWKTGNCWWTGKAGNCRAGGRLLVLGAGKGVAPMGAAVEELLGDRIDTGMLVVKYGHGLPLQQIAQVEAAHPVPDAAGAAATRALLNWPPGQRRMI